MSNVCANCIEDPFLSEIVSAGDEIGLCSICDIDELPVITSKQLGQLLEPLLKERLKFGNEIKVFSGPNDDKGGWEQQGDPLEYFVSEFLAQDFEFFDEIVEAVVEAENVWPQDGEEAFFEDYYNFVRAPVFPHQLLDKWQSVSNEIYKSRRFFSTSAKELFSFLFKDIQKAQALTSYEFKNVVYDLSEGTEIFRARACPSQTTLREAFNAPLLHVGPPPSQKASPGRMNAEGVSVLYGALDSDTAIAELRPSLGGDTLVISLMTTKSLRLLDFKRLEKVFSSISDFDPNYDEKIERHVFLKRLHSLISKPVIPGKEIEYLITQVMSEYLAHIHDEPFDGVLFSSVQKQGGTNIVIFQDSDGSFSVDYINGSLKAFYTKEIKHTHTERQIYKSDGEIHIDDFYAGFEPDDW